jgi:anti-anti-sigma factor
MEYFMQITRHDNGNSLTLVVEGVIDSTTAPVFEAELVEACQKSKNVIVDFEKVDFISSAGLRALLISQKKMMTASGKMTLVHVKDDVREVFELTGFISVLNIA